jgi:hypothetical protein
MLVTMWVCGGIQINRLALQHENKMLIRIYDFLTGTRQNLMQKIQQFENLAKLEEWMPMEENSRFEEEEEENEIERKVRELLNHVKATSSIDIGKAKVDIVTPPAR